MTRKTEARTFHWRAMSLDMGLSGWPDLWAESWPAYRRWWAQEGTLVRPPMDVCQAAMHRHMPQLVPLWDRLSPVGGSDEGARFLSHWCPPAYIKGCSQAAVADPAPQLVRNYDYGADSFDALVLRTEWLGRQVIGVSDGLWGLLDGINDAGLSLSLAFGGRRQLGSGFGIPLILRYVLQVAETTAGAVKLLRSLPSHMSYNVTAIDADGIRATVRLAPDRPAREAEAGFATNHQDDPSDWPEYARFSRTFARCDHLAEILSQAQPGADLVARFLERPLYASNFNGGFGTLYTASYRPRDRSVLLAWPGRTKSFSVSEAPDWRADLTLGRSAQENAV